MRSHTLLSTLRLYISHSQALTEDSGNSFGNYKLSLTLYHKPENVTFADQGPVKGWSRVFQQTPNMGVSVSEIAQSVRHQRTRLPAPKLCSFQQLRHNLIGLVWRGAQSRSDESSGAAASCPRRDRMDAWMDRFTGQRAVVCLGIRGVLRQGERL